jgi:hypothetical protein
MHTAQYLKVHVTYRGEPLTQKYFNEHPEIQKLYPSKEVFLNKLYIPLFQKAKETQSEQILEISEDSIKINGEKMLVM